MEKFLSHFKTFFDNRWTFLKKIVLAQQPKRSHFEKNDKERNLIKVDGIDFLIIKVDMFILILLQNYFQPYA